MIRARPHAQGFTLIEIIISMSLLALVTGICYAAFHLGIRAVAKGEVAVVTAQRLRVATDVLIRQVKSTASSPALLDGDTYPYFYGTPTSMSFITDAGQLSGGGRSHVTYHIEKDPPQLVLDESPYFTAESLGQGTPDASEARSAVILDGFREARFEFFDGSDSEECGKSGWCKRWDYAEMEILPTAVRVIVEGLPGLQEDIWGQEIPIMTATYGEEPPEPTYQECDNLASQTPTDGSGGSGTGKSSGGEPEEPEDPDEDD